MFKKIRSKAIAIKNKFIHAYSRNAFDVVKKKILFYKHNKKITSFPPPLKVNLACGQDYKTGWLNIDQYIDPNAKKTHMTIECDLVKHFPFKRSSVLYFYSEHFIEHITYADGLDFLKKIYKSLKPGGVLRISCPNLEDLTLHYLNNSWNMEEWKRNYPDIRGRCDIMNRYMAFDYWGHKYVYDKEELINSLRLAGFEVKNIKSVSLGKSEHDELNNLEIRVNSMVFEAKK
jgi:predicted SAM-dependent methyltransferase